VVSVRALRNVPAGTLVAGQLAAGPPAGLPFVPVIDGHLLTRPPAAHLAQGAAAGITAWTGSGPDIDHLTTWTQQRWLAFAGTGTPAGPDVVWPNHDPARRPTMIIGPQPHVEEAPLRQRTDSCQRRSPRLTLEQTAHVQTRFISAAMRGESQCRVRFA